MSLLDLVLVIIVLLSMVAAVRKGFVHESLMILATLVGIGLAVWKYPVTARWFGFLTATEPVRDFLGFTTIVVAVMLIALIVAKLVAGFLQAVGLRWFDRLLGAALGLVRGVLLCTVLLMVLTAFPFALDAVRGSALAPDFLSAAETIVRWMPASIRIPFERGLGQVRGVSRPVSAAGTPPGRSSTR